MPLSRTRRAGALAGAIAALLALGASAVAAQAADTKIIVTPRVVLSAPAVSPVDFPGVSTVRAGQALPRRWVVVSRNVKIARGDEVAYAAMRMTCPKGTTWRTGASSGAIGAQVLDRTTRGRRSILVMATIAAGVKPGEIAAGTVYALCR
jgi:hypothetical protein